MEAGEIQLGDDPPTFCEVGFAVTIDERHKVFTNGVAAELFLFVFGEDTGLENWEISGFDATYADPHAAVWDLEAIEERAIPNLFDVMLVAVLSAFSCEVGFVEFSCVGT